MSCFVFKKCCLTYSTRSILCTNSILLRVPLISVVLYRRRFWCIVPSVSGCFRIWLKFTKGRKLQVGALYGYLFSSLYACVSPISIQAWEGERAPIMSLNSEFPLFCGLPVRVRTPADAPCKALEKTHTHLAYRNSPCTQYFPCILLQWFEKHNLIPLN